MMIGLGFSIADLVARLRPAPPPPTWADATAWNDNATWSDAA